MAIHTRQQLADFMLRQLGAPILVIEVDAQHLEDAIELTMQQYHEYHFDSIVRDYLIHKITGTTVVVTDATGIRKGDQLLSIDGKTKALIADVQNNTITINHQIGYEKFFVNQVVRGSNNASSTIIESIVLGDVDNGYISAGDNIVGVTKILNITSILGSSDYMFNMQYQLMMTELQALTKGGASMYWQTMNYLGHLDFIMKKEKNYTFNRRMNRLYLEVAWGTDISVGDMVVAEVYRAIDETVFTEVYDDIWVKKYATALLKKQWGTNLKKYQGMQLPGGLTYNGQQTYDEAMIEIKNLEDEATYSSAPLEFAVG